MTGNEHERAQEMIALGDKQQLWLRGHLENCAACRDYAEAVGRAVSALHSRPLTPQADTDLVQTTRMRVRNRAAELRQKRERLWLVCLACSLVSLSAVVTTPLCWRAFAWIGSSAGFSNPVWQTCFALFWIVPALVVGIILGARGIHLSNYGKRAY